MDRDWLKQVARLGIFIRNLPFDHAEDVGDVLVVTGLCLQDYYDCTDFPQKWHRMLTGAFAVMAISRRLMQDRRRH